LIELSKVNANRKTISDVTVSAVVSNNIVAIDQAKDVGDASKKLKVATSKEADVKLKNYQKRVISMNDSLLQLYSHKYSACKDQAQKLIDKYPDNDNLYLILASATYHQHKATKAVEELKKFSEKKPSSVAIRFATIQLQLLESQPAQALATLEAYLATVKDNKNQYYKPAIIALLVWLYEQTGQSEKAMEILDEATTVWKNDKSFVSTATVAPTSTIKQTAAFKLKTGRFQDAVTDYEQLVKADPSDTQAIAGLIAAYAEVDSKKAEQYGNALPAIALNHLDIETLETIVPGVKRGYVKKDPNGVHVKKPKTKKKRATLYPKNMDPNVKPDSERWIPKQERSTYRMKGKNKKALNKGPQGVSMEGGGIGGTGSANIGGKKTVSVAMVTEETVTKDKPVNATPSSKSSNKKKKGKGKGKK
jgi:signal recognition particle subunit SRP72